MNIIKIKNGGPTIAIVGLLHGNERLGMHVIGLLKKDYFDASLIFVVANEEAENVNSRFIESDLNRSFPGNINGSFEERLAFKMLNELSGCDFIIDIHSTTAKTEGFIITTKQDEKMMDLINSISLNKVVYMGHSIASGKALIDHVACGVSLEFNENTSVQEVYLMVRSAIENLTHKRYLKQKKNIFEVYDVLNESDLPLINFEKIKFGDEEFYPVLFGEMSYSFKCLKAKRIK